MAGRGEDKITEQVTWFISLWSSDLPFAVFKLAALDLGDISTMP